MSTISMLIQPRKKPSNDSNGHMQCAPTMGAEIKFFERAHAMCPYDERQNKIARRGTLHVPQEDRMNFVRAYVQMRQMRHAQKKIPTSQ